MKKTYICPNTLVVVVDAQLPLASSAKGTGVFGGNADGSKPVLAPRSSDWNDYEGN